MKRDKSQQAGCIERFRELLKDAKAIQAPAVLYHGGSYEVNEVPTGAVWATDNREYAKAYPHDPTLDMNDSKRKLFEIEPPKGARVLLVPTSRKLMSVVYEPLIQRNEVDAYHEFVREDISVLFPNPNIIGIYNNNGINEYVVSLRSVKLMSISGK